MRWLCLCDPDAECIADSSCDIQTLEHISTGKLLQQGDRIVKSKVRMRWELDEEPSYPTMEWVRVAPLPDTKVLAQICFRFETKQVGHSRYHQHSRLTPALDHVG